MPIISISLTTHLLRQLDSLIKNRGYSSRSEAIRDAIRSSLDEFQLSRFEQGRVIATITVISEHEKHDVDERLTRLRHQHNAIVSGNMHLHLGNRYCLDVLITEGEAKEVITFISQIRAMRGIRQVTYTFAPLVQHPEDAGGM
ncbi:MAG: nickel-responsive transcriptional regulator NikR [Promethearchaeota archaeon]